MVLINSVNKYLKLGIIGNLLVLKSLIGNNKLIGGPLSSDLGKRIKMMLTKIKRFKHIF